MAYDKVITELNSARLRGTSFPIVHALIEASVTVASDVRVSSLFKLRLNSKESIVQVYANDPELPCSF